MQIVIALVMTNNRMVLIFRFTTHLAMINNRMVVVHSPVHNPSIEDEQHSNLVHNLSTMVIRNLAVVHDVV